MDRVRYIDMTDAMPMRVVIDQHAAILAAIRAATMPRPPGRHARPSLRDPEIPAPRREQHADLFEEAGR